MTTDLLAAAPVGVGGFTGSPITAWCATCQDHAVPMNDGTCGFCRTGITDQGAPPDRQRRSSCPSKP